MPCGLVEVLFTFLMFSKPSSLTSKLFLKTPMTKREKSDEKHVIMGKMAVGKILPPRDRGCMVAKESNLQIKDICNRLFGLKCCSPKIYNTLHLPKIYIAHYYLETYVFLGRR